ncbi:DUF1104 domain-containing protein [Hydrogenimonas thermophila]|uniref:Uncharacterized protein n=1 Tax=Hydrogenimonas thermophila TaxID=223786 RepID=A0A1I5MD65_9BACT|nr:DUF1104 domain-containing protein [Hydrogenimonas thermophila]WOE70660.1 DUF1104 domain-containing protein [Hydrogenimonas thermophila]WOE73178.1 DUF1104 domain-containing protein [Hydrogenimonas thermophila]SFP07558.1 Protein of unknown function [Hydrogenimonas thermophila]
MRFIISILLVFTIVWSIDYSDRSTQELIASLAYEKSTNIPIILHELKKRELTMSPKEKKEYKKVLKKLKDESQK